jgi:uncharacterized protein (DUF1015 family)
MIKDIDIKLIDELLDKIRQDFKAITAEHLAMPPTGSLGMYYKNNYYFLTPLQKHCLLDIEVLHKHILEPFMGLSEEKIKSGDYVHYISGDKDISKILKPVKPGKYQIGFILNPTTFEDIIKISNHGKTMPRKSTYFYPKVPSGIVMYKAT